MQSLLIAIAVVAPTYVIFKYVLYARFPAGILRSRLRARRDGHADPYAAGLHQRGAVAGAVDDGARHADRHLCRHHPRALVRDVGGAVSAAHIHHEPAARDHLSDFDLCVCRLRRRADGDPAEHARLAAERGDHAGRLRADQAGTRCRGSGVLDLVFGLWRLDLLCRHAAVDRLRCDRGAEVRSARDVSGGDRRRHRARRRRLRVGGEDDGVGRFRTACGHDRHRSDRRVAGDLRRTLSRRRHADHSGADRHVRLFRTDADDVSRIRHRLHDHREAQPARYLQRLPSAGLDAAGLHAVHRARHRRRSVACRWRHGGIVCVLFALAKAIQPERGVRQGQRRGRRSRPKAPTTRARAATS